MKTTIIFKQEHVGNDNQSYAGTDNQLMTSLEIAEITGKPHNDVLKAIRKMEQAWVKVTQGNFSLSTYSTFETASLRYFRSKKLKQVWFFPHLIVPLQLQIPNWE